MFQVIAQPVLGGGFARRRLHHGVRPVDRRLQLGIRQHIHRRRGRRRDVLELPVIDQLELLLRHSPSAAIDSQSGRRLESAETNLKIAIVEHTPHDAERSAAKASLLVGSICEPHHHPIPFLKFAHRSGPLLVNYR